MGVEAKAAIKVNLVMDCLDIVPNTGEAVEVAVVLVTRI